MAPVLLAIVMLATVPPCMRAAAAAETPSVGTDFSRYQSLLDDHLHVTSAPGEPLETRFDYFKLFRDPVRVERLLRIHSGLVAATPSKLAPAERRAWAINTYNFLVLEHATKHLVSRHVSAQQKARGIFGIPFTSVLHMQVDGPGFFDVAVAEIEGKQYTLDAFERTFVFDGFRWPKTPAAAAIADRKKPPRTLDPRVHFALVCGAAGCPPLQPRAFVAESLEIQLSRATRGALQSPRHLKWDATLGRLAASSIFTWYEADFGGPAGAFQFLREHAPDPLASALAAKQPQSIDTFIVWDWKLNSVPPAAAKTTQRAN